jgi:hypothetical protein
MTENSSFLHTRHGATHEMQIGAADSAGGQTHNGVEIVLYRRLLDVVESNVSNSMVNDGFHSYSPEKSFWGFVARLGFRILFAQTIAMSGFAWRLWRLAFLEQCEWISANEQWCVCVWRLGQLS